MKKLIACFLALTMVLLALAMVGCGDNTTSESTGSTASNPIETTSKPSTPGSEETTNAPGIHETTTETVPEETSTEHVPDPKTEKMPGFEDLNFNGRTFVFATEDESGGDGWYTDFEVYPASSRTDAVSVAVRQRNALIEKLYNCKIDMKASSTPGAFVSADLTSQKHTIDFYTYEYGCEGMKMANGNNYNLLPYINTANPWWDQKYVNAFTVKKNNGANVLCSIVGDFALSSFRAAHALTFNKTVYENADITDDVYQLVRDGKWTMDKFVDMVKAVAYDSNGNGEYHYSEGDTLGWVRTAHASHGMHVASGMPLITNSDGTFSFAPSSQADTWYSVMDKAIDVWQNECGETLGYTNVRLAMQEGKTLFASEIIAIVEYMKDVNDLFVGFLPYPKYSEEQENYAHYVDNHLAPYGMPVSVPDPEIAGQFLEVYAYHSRYIVREAYINTYAYTYCSDAESEEMLNIILDTRTYDPGYLCWSEFEGQMSNMVLGGTNNSTGFASRYAGVLSKNAANLVNYVSEKYPD